MGWFRPAADALHFAGFELLVIETHRVDFFLSALFLKRVVILDHFFILLPSNPFKAHAIFAFLSPTSGFPRHLQTVL
jgi:hypothetical protein